MARPKSLKPKHCHHRSTGRGFVILGGEWKYTGPWGSQQAQDEYDRLIGEWIAAGRPSAQKPAQQAQGQRSGAGAGDGATTINVILAAFWTWAKGHYLNPDGSPSPELENYKCAIRPLRRLYGRTPATEFGPKKLKALQGEMVRMGWTRKYLNRHVRRIQAIFRWVVSEELLPPSVSQALDTVAGLKRGKGGAAEAPPVKPVEQETVNQTLPHLPDPVAAMVRLQLLTGMRSGETCIMRTGDIDRGKPVWVYRPAKHKTEHHGHTREIRIGPKAQTVLTPWLKLDPAAYLFSPAESEADRHEQMREARATPVTKSQQARARLAKRRRRSRAPKDRYTPHSYAKAIGRGCEAAFPAPEHLARRRVAGNGRKAKSERWETRREWYARLGEEGLKELRAWRRAHNWHPHQLRHTAGTVIRREGGVDVAGAFLGHSSLNTTQIYAEQDAKRVEEIVARVG